MCVEKKNSTRRNCLELLYVYIVRVYDLEGEDREKPVLKIRIFIIFIRFLRYFLQKKKTQPLVSATFTQ